MGGGGGGGGSADLIAVGGPPHNIQLADIGDGFEGLEAGLLWPGGQREQVLPGVLHICEVSNLMFSTSVWDPAPNPDPDPPDQHVFGPPRSGSISQRYGSGSFYQQAKKVRKTLIPTVPRRLYFPALQ
jgi:hypothetical protein